MSHVVLLGDSIFDNARYVPGGPAVIEHLRKELSAGWKATLLAVDGSVAEDVPRQLRRVPQDATHLVVSTGGNNALYSSSLLREPAASIGEALTQMGAVRAEFQLEYRGMIDAVRSHGLPAAACTVYDAIPSLDPAAHTGLCLFNEVILVEAARAGLPVVDLRLVCRERSDYSSLSPIEPSAAGGAKIARAVAKVVADHEFAKGGCRIYP